jgi:uncharacterized protein
MRPGVLLDTGPLVAYFCGGESHHRWAVQTLATLGSPIISCEPVLTEACFVIAQNGLPAARAIEPFERGLIKIGLRAEDELAPIRALMERYANVPMSFADACLVRLAELTGLPICTLDSDFAIYRTQRGRALDLISPASYRAIHEP